MATMFDVSPLTDLQRNQRLIAFSSRQRTRRWIQYSKVSDSTTLQKMATILISPPRSFPFIKQQLPVVASHIVALVFAFRPPTFLPHSSVAIRFPFRVRESCSKPETSPSGRKMSPAVNAFGFQSRKYFPLHVDCFPARAKAEMVIAFRRLIRFRVPRGSVFLEALGGLGTRTSSDSAAATFSLTIITQPREDWDTPISRADFDVTQGNLARGTDGVQFVFSRRYFVWHRNPKLMSEIFGCVQLPTSSGSFPRHCTRAAAGPPPRYENFRPPTGCSSNFSTGINDYLAHCGESSAMLEESLSLDDSATDPEEGEESTRRHSFNCHKAVENTGSSNCALPTRRPKHSRNVILRKWQRLMGEKWPGSAKEGDHQFAPLNKQLCKRSCGDVRPTLIPFVIKRGFGKSGERPVCSEDQRISERRPRWGQLDPRSQLVVCPQPGLHTGTAIPLLRGFWLGFSFAFSAVWQQLACTINEF
ncbi:hypothetical protein L596_011045 [Steinernema carpocapsae]|uniref:Uncharacterized protein n=1 Tax=Steinernema carpocapsae TaxID=34508 RepID=A0A4U5NTH4_STECR|nr:hypothetical protein L596_011045 [Steinernema carpocapsae]